MSHIEDTVDSLETKVIKLLNAFEILKKEYTNTKNKLQGTQQELVNTQNEVTHWKSQYDTLKIANAMLGSDENKRETKLKINALIREIDHCIGQLSE